MIFFKLTNQYRISDTLFLFGFVFPYLFHVFFSLSLTLIISIFCCLNYNSLSFHLITINLVSHLSISSIIFITSLPVICIFYCLDYTLLLLHPIITQFVNIFYDNCIINICHKAIIMVYISITKELEKYHSMIEKHSLKNVIFFQTILKLFCQQQKEIFFLCFGIRNFIVLWYHNILTR